MFKPYLITSAAYSIGMLLYYCLHVFYFRRDDPTWLSELYFIVFALPAIVSLTWLPLSIRENTYRHFLRYSFYLFTAFNFICFLSGANMICVKRWISALLMVGIPLAFLALFLKLTYSKIKDL